MEEHEKEEGEKSAAKTWLKTRLGRGALFGFAGLWAVGVTVPLALSCVSHLVELPIAKTAISLDDLHSDAEWSIIHVVSEECVCSEGVLEYLESRGTVAEREEAIVLVNSSEATMQRLRRLGYAATLVEAESFCGAFGAEGVPFFQVLRDDSLAYSGTYFEGAYRGNNTFLDLDTFNAVEKGIQVEERPVFGCPTSKRLRSILDPLGIRFES